MATRSPGDSDAEPAGNVLSLSRRRPERDPGVRQHGGGHPVAFGVELPARPDIVFSIAALTQLITIADGAGVSATADLHRVIADLRRRLSSRNVALPAALEDLVEQLAPDPGGGCAGIGLVPRSGDPGSTLGAAGDEDKGGLTRRSRAATGDRIDGNPFG